VDYRLWVSEDRTRLVRLWGDGSMEICERPDPGAIWGPPITVTEERDGRPDQKQEGTP
jgi:hypothetical protein